MMPTNTFYENQLMNAPLKYHRKTRSNLIDSEALLHLIKAKNERGFNIFYDKYCGSIYGILIKIVKRNDIADDLMQDTFVKIWKNIDQYNATKGTLFTWMLNIARNLAIDYLRSACHRNEIQNIKLDIISTQKGYHNAIAIENNEIEFNDLKANALQILTPKYAEVIDAIYFFGCTHEQAAEVLNLPLGTIKTRARTGLSVLRTLYKIE